MSGFFSYSPFEYDRIEPGAKTIFSDGVICLRKLREYQARLLFAEELLTRWGAEPAAAERFRKEAKIAEDICQDVRRKLVRVMAARGMKDQKINLYFFQHGLGNALWSPDPEMIYGVQQRTIYGDTARTIADKALYDRV